MTQASAAVLKLPKGTLRVSCPARSKLVTSRNRVLCGLAAVVAFERAQIVERTNERLARAKAQEKKLGRPKGSLDKKKRSRRGYFARWAD